MLTCDEPGCSKKIYLEKDCSKNRLYEKARKLGWKVDDKKTGECRCVGHRLIHNRGFNHIKKGDKK